MTTAAPARRLSDDTRSDLLVLLVAAIALIVAFVYQYSLASKTSVFTDPHSGLTLSVPDNWTVTQTTDDPEVFVSAYDTRADSVFKSTIIGRSFALDTDNPADLDTIVNGLVDDRQKNLLAFHLIQTETLTLSGSEGRAIHYAYVTQPIDDAFTNSTPIVVTATDYIIYSPGKEYWVITTAADEKIADRERADFDTIVNSVHKP